MHINDRRTFPGFLASPRIQLSGWREDDYVGCRDHLTSKSLLLLFALSDNDSFWILSSSDVFGHSASSKQSSTAPVDATDDFELMQQQRAAKRARAANADSGAVSGVA